ncbi:MAG: Holliday junction resolvase RuvX, partial [Nitriliruptoraceae bacterium]
MSMQQPEDLPLSGRIVAFDLGEVRVGVALSDPGQVIASPFETLTVPRGDDNALVGALVRAIGRHVAAGVV